MIFPARNLQRVVPQVLQHGMPARLHCATWRSHSADTPNVGICLTASEEPYVCWFTQPASSKCIWVVWNLCTPNPMVKHHFPGNQMLQLEVLYTPCPDTSIFFTTNPTAWWACRCSGPITPSTPLTEPGPTRWPGPWASKQCQLTSRSPNTLQGWPGRSRSGRADLGPVRSVLPRSMWCGSRPVKMSPAFRDSLEMQIGGVVGQCMR